MKVSKRGKTVSIRFDTNSAQDQQIARSLLETEREARGYSQKQPEEKSTGSTSN